MSASILGEVGHLTDGAVTPRTTSLPLPGSARAARVPAGPVGGCRASAALGHRRG
ncbi:MULTISPECIES: hypothetical protein [unclassified Streptomyces]|uniref:hypothetical protein n=1 Tax=unclassified Streptomyces TaxID=2593676 RepID=UPI00136EA895|nr:MULTISPECIES: hypothetical protein [unclassified Streptomyces]MCW5248948.1 hypothetical protein [Streptomyces sp. SHP 1-2]